MAQEIQLFQKENLGMVRILGDKDNPLFCLKDVCEILEHTTPTKIKDSIINEFGKGMTQIHPLKTAGGMQNMTFITEPQLYFVLMRSDKSKAKPFRQWVISEVLPAVRKTGSYSVSNVSDRVIVIEEQKMQLERAKMLERLSDNYRGRCDGRYSQILDSYITKELYGEHILPLPERTEHYYTAEEAGKILGISANKVGELAMALFPQRVAWKQKKWLERIANSNHLKNDKYGKWFIDKAKYTNKEIEAFRYNQAGVDCIRKLL